MTNSNDNGAPRRQAEVTGDLDDAGMLYGRTGASVYSIGGPNGYGRHGGGGDPLRVAKRFARRVHGDGHGCRREGGRCRSAKSR
jgi:hypothetical protein